MDRVASANVTNDPGGYATMKNLLFLALAAALSTPAGGVVAQTAPVAKPSIPKAAGQPATRAVAISDALLPDATETQSDAGAAPAAGLAGAYLAARQGALDNNFAEAAIWYGKALQLDPSDPVLQDSTLVALVSSGQLDAAVALVRDPKGPEMKTELAGLLRRAAMAHDGQWTDLLAEGTPDASASPDQGGALLDRMVHAWALMGAGRATDSITAFEALSDIKGAEGIAQYHLALAKAFVGDFEGAEALMARQQGAANLLGVQAHAQVLSQLERNADAADMIAGLGGAENEPALVDLERRLNAGERLPFSAITSPADGIAQVFLTFASALSAGEGADPLALIHARLAVWLAPDMGEARLMTAQLLQEAGQFDLAEQQFEALQQMGDMRPAAELARVDALVRAERMADAEKAARGLTEARPDLAPGWVALGDLLRQQDKWADAITAYDRALDILRKDGADDQAIWFPLYARGIALERSGQFERADADMEAALKIQPQQAPILNYLGYSWVDRNVNLDRGLKLIEQAVKLRPDDGYILDSLAWAYYRMGRYQDAVAPMEKAIATMSNDSLVNDHMGDIYWMAGRKREAEIQWRRALSLWTETDTDTDRDRIRAKLEVGLDKVLAAEAANGGKLPQGFGLPPEPVEAAGDPSDTTVTPQP